MSSSSLPSTTAPGPDARVRVWWSPAARWSRVLVVLALGACAHRPPPQYARARAAAERAYSAGRYEEAAERWLDAAQSASKRSDEVEARYRAATSWQRAGRLDEAQVLLSAIAQDPPSDRSARAAFDRAELLVDRGQEAEGQAARNAAIMQYPESGVARQALLREIGWHRDHGGVAAALAYLDRMEPRLARSELGETVGYERGRLLEEAGERIAARDEYLRVARKYPYPGGALWDDALFRAAELEVALGHPREAIAICKEMLSYREPQLTYGSLERPRFGDARYLMGRIYADELGDLQAARETFLTLAREHPTSRLRDDALWAAALADRRAGDMDAVCQDVAELAREIPDSRYVDCASQLCPRRPPTGHGCRPYILRDIPRPDD